MLSDHFGRSVEYLRLSITDRCDLRCSYCLPKGFKNFEEPAHWLSLDEMARVAAAFARMGAKHIRLTGGEPLLRRGLSELAARLARLPGVSDLSLSTNATQLDRHADALFRAGVNRLNVSLDSLRSDCVAQLTGSNCLPRVRAGLAAARAAGFENIKINMVPLQGVNDGDIEAMAEFCIAHGFILRLIEAMPMGHIGQRAAGMDLRPVLERLRQRFDLHPLSLNLGGGPARYWRSRDNRFTLGLITPISQHFCASCNRVRLAVDGTLYLCLGQEQRFELRPLLRAGCSDAELEAAIREAIELKPEKHEFAQAPVKMMRFMSQTGG
ncbi:GTP 3',8-cyclase MoaA [Chromobacterium sphagni]|uniref:GTP 3',8-cyclase n=1 Tax=Chromobacterium sphagni TaxID=1903179 RepID=A0A1S1WU98_9NEIS|nr:GTP 3',8-cyclase MoaA [Chromobacterium sphagni]OHX10680.1 cyclic pyranopterin phosphate synthase MoaA [Chromobacterium sphagni]OHX19444.1 cyclic pyranopterin phosphate synthase MoaA [Chromobacterium sphagni]